jgi:aldose 1-epimerase
MREYNFGQLPDGKEVQAVVLNSESGATVEILQLGGIIRSLIIPDGKGNMADVVLGMPTLQHYLAGHPWFGAITGRVAGRITNGTFSIGKKVFKLEINDPPNHLHGGSQALDKKIWEFIDHGADKEGEYVSLRYVSPSGECGYPGKVDIQVTYSLLQNNTLRIKYRATTDDVTPLSLTNHSYFNLAGEDSGPVLDHEVEIAATHVVPTDENLTLQGRIEPVAGTPDDFLIPRRLGDVVGSLLLEHGSNYIFPEGKLLTPRFVARVREPRSGRIMEVWSTEKCLQFYTGRFMDKEPWIGKSGRPYKRFEGMCFECQGYPDGVNTPEVEDILLRPGKIYSQITEYRFFAS